MATKKADAKIVSEIRRLAQDPGRVQFSPTARHDMQAHKLVPVDVCAEIIRWIDCGNPVKEVVIHSIPHLIGQPAYEIKPRIKNILFYIKLTLVKLGKPDEYMLVISTHPDH